MLSKKTKYGLKALTHLALNRVNKLVVSLKFYKKWADCPDEAACSVHKLMLMVRYINLIVYFENTLTDLIR